MKKLIPAIAVAMIIPSLWAVPGTVSNSKDSKKGDVKYDAREKEYVVSYKKGSTQVETRFKAGKDVELDIEKPADFDKLVKMVESKKGDKAISGLKTIVADYANLQWDKPAARYLTRAYLDAKKFDDALQVAQKVIDGDKTAAYKGELAPEYWQALHAKGRLDELNKLIDTATKSGDRAASAWALVMRGNIAKDANNPDYRQILVDSYLKVYLMYTDPQCTDARKRAMEEAAKCFDNLGMSSRAAQIKEEAANL